MKLTPWGRILWMLQIVYASFAELEQHERLLARDIAQRVYRDRRLDPTCENRPGLRPAPVSFHT